MKPSEITFDIIEHIGVIESRPDGWTKEVNIVSWNGGQAKIDIRDWDPSHERMTRGITLAEDSAEVLMLHLKDYFLNKRGEDDET